MVRGSPSMCMSTTPAPDAATTPAIRGSARMAETSLTMTAPAWRAASATPAFIVSTETGTPAFPASASMTGTTRASSSASATGSAPGRVDSPPTSIRSTPSATISIPRATAAPGSENRPPSEKESGVTFRMPITCVRSRTGRARSRQRQAAPLSTRGPSTRSSGTFQDHAVELADPVGGPDALAPVDVGLDDGDHRLLALQGEDEHRRAEVVEGPGEQEGPLVRELAQAIEMLRPVRGPALGRPLRVGGLDDETWLGVDHAADSFTALRG